MRLKVEGERALFARPEFRDDRVSYDLITPHAARGVFDAIYWRPGMTWVIDAIEVLHPIRHEHRHDQQGRALLLRDVAYVIDAHFELAPGETSGRHAAMFKRLARASPEIYLGNAALVGRATLLSADTPAPVRSGTATADYGWLLHSIDFARDRRMRFFRAQAVDGVVRVPPPNDASLMS